MFNIENFYTAQGEELFFDINHTTFEDDISYHRIEVGNGDLSWLNLSEDGILSGTVPEDFQYGGGNVVTNVTSDGNNFELRTDWLWIDNPFRENNGGDQARIGDTWTNSTFENPQYVNSTNEAKIFNGITIDANTIYLADGSIYQISEYEVFRDGVGVELINPFDDYIDLSGYTIEDFLRLDMGRILQLHPQ